MKYYWLILIFYATAKPKIVPAISFTIFVLNFINVIFSSYQISDDICFDLVAKEINHNTFHIDKDNWADLPE